MSNSTLRKPVPILMYHRIAPMRRESTVKGHYVHPKMFERQMKLIRKLRFSPIELAGLAASSWSLPSKPIVLTFDDGYTNFFTNALPVLHRLEMRSTVFLVADLLGRVNEWDRKLGDVEESLMDVDQIRQAQNCRTSFGSHSLDHADLTATEPHEAWRQIADSKAVLQQVLGQPVTTFCYPYGRKTLEVQGLVRDAGYGLACSTEKGLNTEDIDRFALKRINIRNDTLMPVFLYKLWRGSRLAR